MNKDSTFSIVSLIIAIFSFALYMFIPNEFIRFLCGVGTFLFLLIYFIIDFSLVLEKESARQLNEREDSELDGIRRWEAIIGGNEYDFMQTFCPAAWILNDVSWDSENMRFTYILDCGQHVANSVKIAEWFNFLKKQNEKRKGKS